MGYLFRPVLSWTKEESIKMIIDKIDQIGKRIREQRKSRNMTIAELAEAAHIHPVYLGEIECGKKSPSLVTYINIVNALGISSDICIDDKSCAKNSHILNEVTEMIGDLPQQQLNIIKMAVKTMVDHIKSV